MRMFVGQKTICLAAALVAAFGAFWQTPPPAPAENVIHVEISGLLNDKGQMLCALFSSAEAFPKKPEKAVAEVSRCLTMGLPNYRLFTTDPNLKSLHHDPAFMSVMTAMRREYDRVATVVAPAF